MTLRWLARQLYRLTRCALGFHFSPAGVDPRWGVAWECENCGEVRPVRRRRHG